MSEITLLSEQVEGMYDKQEERIRHHEWRIDKILANIIGACLNSRLLPEPRLNHAKKSVFKKVK